MSVSQWLASFSSTTAKPYQTRMKTVMEHADRAFEPGLGAETTVFVVLCTSTSRSIAADRGDNASAQLRRTGTASFKLAGSSQVRAMEGMCS